MGNVTLEDSMKYTTYKDSIGMSGGSAPIMYNGKRVATQDRPYWQISNPYIMYYVSDYSNKFVSLSVTAIL